MTIKRKKPMRRALTRAEIQQDALDLSQQILAILVKQNEPLSGHDLRVALGLVPGTQSSARLDRALAVLVGDKVQAYHYPRAAGATRSKWVYWIDGIARRPDALVTGAAGGHHIPRGAGNGNQAAPRPQRSPVDLTGCLVVRRAALRTLVDTLLSGGSIDGESEQLMREVGLV